MKNTRIATISAGILAAAALIFFLLRGDHSSVGFEAACEARLEQRQFRNSIRARLCTELSNRFFVNDAPAQPITPALVMAPALPIDRKVRFIALHDPIELSRIAYCYFVFRGWFDPHKMTPNQLSESTSGFSILKTELNGYRDWLSSSKGGECKRSLRESIGADPADLEVELANQNALIAFNPLAAIRSDDGIDAVMRDAMSTINHERIHVIQITCPALDQWAQNHWDSTPQPEKQKLIQAHPDYDWSQRTVAVRESLAFQFEANPRKILGYVGDCQF